MNPINHVAIIMDGNGRWGLKNKKSRNSGHNSSSVAPMQKQSILHSVLENQHMFFSNLNHSSPEHLRILNELSELLLEGAQRYATLPSNHNSIHCLR